MVAAPVRFTQRRSQPRQFSLAASVDGRISRRDTSQQRSFSPPPPPSDALRSVHATSCSRRSPFFGCHNTTAGQRSDVRSLDLLLGTGGGEEKGRGGGGGVKAPLGASSRTYKEAHSPSSSQVVEFLLVCPPPFSPQERMR